MGKQSEEGEHYFIACTIFLYIHNRTAIASIRNHMARSSVYLVLMRSSFVCHLQEPDSELAPSFLWDLPPFCLIHQFFKNVGRWEVFIFLTQFVCRSLSLQHSIIIINQSLHHLTGRHIGISIVVAYVL